LISGLTAILSFSLPKIRNALNQEPVKNPGGLLAEKKFKFPHVTPILFIFLLFNALFLYRRKTFTI